MKPAAAQIATPLFVGLGMATLMIGSFAHAQTVNPTSTDPTYVQQQQDYQQKQQQYQDSKSAYDAQKGVYHEQRAAYEDARARFHQQQVAYDDQYGAGAYYHHWRDHMDDYNARYGPGAWERDFGANGYYDGPR
ncbi:MAG: hypothetical protein ABSD80_06620 [Caulobacteraceae bacterium]